MNYTEVLSERETEQEYNNIIVHKMIERVYYYCTGREAEVNTGRL